MINEKERLIELAKQHGLTVKETENAEEAGIFIQRKNGTKKRMMSEELFPELLELRR